MTRHSWPLSNPLGLTADAPGGGGGGSMLALADVSNRDLESSGATAI